LTLFKLARLFILNELKAVHVPSKEHREFRLLVKNSKSIDYRITPVVVAWAMLRNKTGWKKAVMAKVTSSYNGRERKVETAKNASGV